MFPGPLIVILITRQYLLKVFREYYLPLSVMIKKKLEQYYYVQYTMPIYEPDMFAEVVWYKYYD